MNGHFRASIRPDFAALNRAAAAEMALRQQEAGRTPPPSATRKVIDGVPHQWCAEHGWVVGCNDLVALDYRPVRIPGESTIDVARWSAPLSASPSYPGLVGRRRRPGWWQRRLPALPHWVRTVNRACAVAAVILGAEAALFTWLTPSAVPAYSMVAGLLLPGVGLLFGLFIDHNRHVE